MALCSSTIMLRMIDMNNCKYCVETKEEKIIGVRIIYQYENPEAMVYPDIAYWEKGYTTNRCPICGRKIKDTKV